MTFPKGKKTILGRLINLNKKECKRFYTPENCPSGNYKLSCELNAHHYRYEGLLKSEKKELVLLGVTPKKVKPSQEVKMTFNVSNLSIYSMLYYVFILLANIYQELEICACLHNTSTRMHRS